MYTGFRFFVVFSIVIPLLPAQAQDFVALDNTSTSQVQACTIPVSGSTEAASCSFPTVNEEVVLNTFEFTLYPNPTRNIVYLHLPAIGAESALISLFRSDGQLVKEEQLPFLPLSFAYYLPADLPVGNYFVRVKSETGVSQTCLSICGY